jgi:hypothetical protein
MPRKFQVGDLVRIRTHADPIMRVAADNAEALERASESIVRCEWDDYGTTPPTHRTAVYPLADVVHVFPPIDVDGD